MGKKVGLQHKPYKGFLVACDSFYCATLCAHRSSRRYTYGYRGILPRYAFLLRRVQVSRTPL
jgi:hypothetical protein